MQPCSILGNCYTSAAVVPLKVLSLSKCQPTSHSSHQYEQQGTGKLKLSIIVITYEMARELPRTLESLQRQYQLACEDIEYEVLVIDNGSPNPVTEDKISSKGREFKSFYLDSPPPSPAYALNFGVEQAQGELICVMIDGAHLLTPGIINKALASFNAVPGAVAAIRYFYLGPGEQNETIEQGYNKEEEDRLLEEIRWPSDGYRLFEIGTPLIYKDFPIYTWLYTPVESNCLFMRRENWYDIGGADERFDLPGGGFLNLDLFKRACDHPNAQPVMIIGEGSFHQLHGGVTTNASKELQKQRIETYKQQYREIRGRDLEATTKSLYFYGNMPTPASQIHRLNRNRTR